MNLPRENLITIEEFYKKREVTDGLLEYVDGIVFMSPSPSTKHQRISGRLHAKLFNFLEGKDCEVFHAPFDVELSHKNLDGNKIVIPDLSVICDKSGLMENKYVGVPALIVEILSPSNQAHDLVFKLNLYMQYGVKEYWIINPMLNIVQVYILDEEGQYQQMDALKEKGVMKSQVVKGFQIRLEELF
ncbi:Uma2 family endonuclease [Aneurinibacillus tyrosinisolvens]|uniref:Uma2 family endonuclease n=1 Tax=Aneurinibacillus tyrosinisolvens TaxID=1443435 RepID=UPI00063F38DB|nr:Uma2 family endonuclease [Aneurinibacillus tyrosinisolvens]